jgi:translocation and assembly module TamB
MATTRRLGRWMLFALALGAIIAIVLSIGVEIYLSSSAGKSMVAREIALRIGMPVEVRSVRLGLRSSSIALRVFDPSLDSDSGEVFRVNSATADISILDIIRGHIEPKSVSLQGVKLTIRVDAKGKVLTPIPKSPENEGTEKAIPIPNIKMAGGRIEILQEGRPEFSLQNLELSVDSEAGGDVKISGGIDDPEWSKWTVSGNINRDSKTGWLELATNDGPLSLDRLKSIPFVPASVWERVHPDGRGAIDLHLNESSDHEVHYSVKIKPSGASITVTDADTTLTSVTGLIRVAGSRLDLQGTQARLAGGTLSVDGGVDFGPEPTKATFNVAANGLDLQELPDDWGLPKDIAGKLQGKADLTLLFHADGHVETQGGGSGTIEDAKISGIPVSIAMRLVSNGKAYRFENPVSKPKSGTKTGIRSIRLFNQNVVQFISLPVNEVLEQPKKEDPPTHLAANVNLRDVEIAELLEKLKVDLGYKISGKISADIAMSVPLARAASQAAYQFTGKLSSPALQLEGLTIHDLSATVVYQNGKLTLKELSGKIPQPDQPTAKPGTFLGTALVEREPPGGVKLNFSLDRIPLGEVLKAIPGFSLDVQGLVAGKAEFRTTYEKISDATAWVASAELDAPELVVAGRKLNGLQLALDVKQGMAKLKKAAVSIEGIPVTAEATLALTDKYAFSATLLTKGTSATDLRKLVPEVELPDIEGVLDTESHASGTTSPFTLNAAGRITATKLTLAKSTANHIDMKWQLSPERLIVSELKADLFGGNLTGSADVPLSGNKSGKFDLAFKNVNADAATAFIPSFPIQISGQISGKVGGTIAPAKPGQSRIGDLDVDLTAPKLTVQGIPADRLAGKATITNGVLDYRLEGKTLGGSFEIKGRYPDATSKQPAQKPKAERGSFQLTGLDLSRLAPELGISSLTPLRGHIDATFSFDNDLSAGSGRVNIIGLKWGNTSVARELTGVLLLHEGVLRLSELSGRFAGGDARAFAHVHLNQPSRNYFSLSLYGADAKKFFSLAPDAAQKVDGPINLNIQGHLGREVRGSGILSLPNGTIAGVPIADLRVPFDWAMAPGRSGRFNVRQATVNTGTGKATANLTVNWGYEAQVDGLVQFINVPLRTIVPELKSFSLIGNGRITGRFALTGSNVRSLDDLSGDLYATLNQTSVKEIPILQQTIPFLNVSGLAQPFQSGDIRGTLSRGVFRVQRLALVNSGAQVYAEGIITLTGRVDASVVAHTGAIGPQSRALGLLGLRLPAIGPIPIGLIEDVSGFLANRTIRLSITGTTKDPIVHLNAGALLTEEAVRFFLARYIVPAGAAEALGLGFESSAFGKK